MKFPFQFLFSLLLVLFSLLPMGQRNVIAAGTIKFNNGGGTAWNAQSSGTTNSLFSVFFTDDATGWATGEVGTILHTTDGGTTWNAQSSGINHILTSVFFTDPSTGWTVGTNGTILHTTDGGTSWEEQTSGTTSRMASVFFTDANTGWAVGQVGTIRNTTNGGTTWSVQSSGTSIFLASVFFADASTGWIVAQSGTILHTTDGGTTWGPQTSGTTNFLNSVFFTDANTGWAVGQGGTIRHTANGGTTWSAQTSGTTNLLSSVIFTDANAGWTVGDLGTILHTTDGGTTWSTQSSGTTNDLSSGFFIDANSGWTVGDLGTILHTTTGGTGIEPPPPPTLASPPDGSTVSTSVVLSWNSEPGALWYTLQVSTSPYFITSILNETNITGTSRNLNGLQSDTTFYWRVSATNDSSTSSWSDTWSFRTASVPDQVVLESPLNGAQITVDNTPLICHPSAPDVDRYWFEWASDSLFTAGSIDSTGTDTLSVASPLETDQTYYWRVRAHNTAGWGSFSDVWSFSVVITGIDDEKQVPAEYSLSQNYPNPFNPSTTISYGLPAKSHLSLDVFNLLGQRVALLVDGDQEAGYNAVTFDGSGLASGVYIYRLQANPSTGSGFVQTKRLLLLK